MHNIFKNSGIRTMAGTEYLTKNNLHRIGYALGIFFTEKYSRKINILVGNDTRISSGWIKEAVIQGIKQTKSEVFDAQTIPTPFIAKALQSYPNISFDLGIMITASHNSAEYNGLKLLTPYGYLTVKEEESISNIFHKNQNITVQNTDQKKIIDITSFYQNCLKNELVNFTSKNIKVVLDCAHGATINIAKQLFESCGIQNLQLINNSNDGSLINKKSGCLNHATLINNIKKFNADWGCAFDGDGDRIIIGDKEGRIFDGDDILAFILQHQDFQSEKTCIGNLVNNKGLELYLKSKNINLIRADVGERNLIQAMKEHNAQLASEPCGHVIIKKHALCSDGIFTALLFFDTLYTNQIASVNLYKKFPQVHKTIPIDKKSINQNIIDTIAETYNNKLQPGRTVIRKSNTEPIIRVMIEHQDIKEASNIITAISNTILQHIS